MDWFVHTFLPKGGADVETLRAPHLVVGIREPDIREELGNDDPVIVLAPLPGATAQA